MYFSANYGRGRWPKSNQGLIGLEPDLTGCEHPSLLLDLPSSIYSSQLESSWFNRIIFFLKVSEFLFYLENIEGGLGSLWPQRLLSASFLVAVAVVELRLWKASFSLCVLPAFSCSQVVCWSFASFVPLAHHRDVEQSGILRYFYLGSFFI